MDLLFCSDATAAEREEREANRCCIHYSGVRAREFPWVYFKVGNFLLKDSLAEKKEEYF